MTQIAGWRCQVCEKPLGHAISVQYLDVPTVFSMSNMKVTEVCSKDCFETLQRWIKLREKRGNKEV